MNQIAGNARVLAMQMLKGSGPVSNAEGEAAQAALARVNSATTPKEMQLALADFKKTLNDIKTSMHRRANPGGNYQPPAPAPLGENQFIKDGMLLEYEPKTNRVKIIGVAPE
jgi:hypothetical protein